MPHPVNLSMGKSFRCSGT